MTTSVACEWYRGWEIHHNTDWMPIAAGCEFDAYKGGCDLDAQRICGRTLEEVKLEIDDEENEYPESSSTTKDKEGNRE